MLNTTGATVGILLRRSTLALAVVGALALAGALPALAQDAVHTSQGREFWVVFQKNFRDNVVDDQTMQSRPAHPIRLELDISSAVVAKGYFEIPGIGVRREFKVMPGQLLRLAIDTAMQLRGSESIQKLGVHVVTTAPVTLTVLNTRYQTADSYLALPVDALGTAYRVVGYKWLQDDLLSQFAVVATEDATEVTITPSVKTYAGRSGTFVVTLNRGEVYQVIPKFDPNGVSDLTGTLVTSTKPVAVFSGHNCAYVPDKTVKACNLLVEQLPPISAWGSDFIIAPLADRARSVYRVVASEDGTELTANGKPVARLDAGGFHEGQTMGNEAVHLVSSRPVMVAQFSTGYSDRTEPTVVSTRSYEAKAETKPVVTDSMALSDVRRWVSLGPGTVSSETTYNPPPPRQSRSSKKKKENPKVNRSKRGTRKSGRATDVPKEVQSSNPVLVMTVEEEEFKSDFVKDPALSDTLPRKPLEKGNGSVTVDVRPVGSPQAEPSSPKQVEVAHMQETSLLGIGDPMMLLIPPSATYLAEYRIHTAASGSWHHFINVIAPADAVGTLRIDDRDVDVDGVSLAKLFTPVGTSGWQFARIEIAEGVHRISASAPVGIYQYGFGIGENAYNAYGNAAGGSTAKRE